MWQADSSKTAGSRRGRVVRTYILHPAPQGTEPYRCGTTELTEDIAQTSEGVKRTTGSCEWIR